MEVSKPEPPKRGAGPAALAVLLANGRRVEVGHGFDAATLQQLLLLLERI